MSSLHYSTCILTLQIFDEFSFIAGVLTWPIAGPVIFAAVCTRLGCPTESERLPE